MTTPQPVWGADVPVSMPIPADEPIQVDMGGWGMTQFRMVHAISAREYEILSVPVWGPQALSEPEIRGDAAIDAS